MKKSILKTPIKEQMLSRETYQGLLADVVGTQGFTIKRQLKSDSPTLCLPHYLTAIREILDLPNTAELTQEIEITKPHEITE